MASIAERPALKIVRQYTVSPSKVWHAWVSAEALKQWMAPGAGACLEAQADVRVGGRYRILMRSPDGEHHDVSGVYREVLPGRKLVFSWAWKSTPERESVVTVELRAIDGGTQMTLTHEQFFDEAARDRHAHGWEGCLESLARFLATH